VVGAGGQLGRELVAQLGEELAWSGGRAELDVTNDNAVTTVIERVRPDVVFNAAAYNKVDGAEIEPGRALEVNALAPRGLALASREVGARLVHFSTDYVFDGRAGRPYREEDCPRPLGCYGISKLTGDHLVAAAGEEHLTVRTSGVFGAGGSRQKGGSFVDRILARAREGRPLRVVADQTFAPTAAHDLAAAAIALARASARGLVHVTNEGACTWHQLAEAALALAGVPASLEPISAEELGLPAPRPAFSVLDTSRYRDLGLVPLRPWREALAEHLRGARGVRGVGSD
jgi:dTDP-4-dehydrorhamnose reductase